LLKVPRSGVVLFSSFSLAVAAGTLLGPQQSVAAVLAFLSVVVSAAWFTEPWYELFAVVAASLVAVRFLLVEPVHSLALREFGQLLPLASFLLAALLLSAGTRHFRHLRRSTRSHHDALRDETRRHSSQLKALEYQLGNEVAERGRFQRAMACYEAEYQRLFEQASDAILVFAPESEIILEANGKACQLYGISREKLVGSRVRDIFSDSRELDVQLAKITSEVACQGVETVHRRNDGALIHVLASSSKVSYRGVPAILTINHDITERKYYAEQEARLMAEQAARTEAEAGQARVAGILESITDAFFALDKNWCFTYVNREAERLLGESKESLLGKRMWERFPEAIGSLAYRQFHYAMNEQVSTTFDTFYPPLSLWLELHVYASVQGLSVYFRDITERHRAEESLRLSEQALRLSQERLRRAHRAAKFSSWELDVASGLMTWSDGSGAGYGHGDTELQLSYAEWLEQIHPEDRTRVQQAVASTISSGAECNWEFRVRWADNSIHWLAGVSHVVCDVSGNPVSLIGTTVDVTRVRQAEAEVLQLASIVESCDDAIIGMDLNNTITSWNAGAEKIYHYTAHEVVGWPMSVLSPAGAPDDVAENLERIRQGERINHLETLRRRKDGKIIDVLVTISPIYDVEKNIVGFSSISRDITERKKVEQVLRHNEKLAETGRLAASIAHEINNPMATLTDIMFLLEHSLAADNAARQYVAIAQQEAGRISHITSQMLSLYRESKEPVPVDLGEVVESATSLYSGKIKLHNIHAKVRNRCSWEVLAFPAEMRQVLSNLLGNAVEACGGGGTVRIHLYNSRSWREPERRGVRIVIADNGGGISAEYHQRLFQPFFTTKGEKGTGLGLWVTDGIVRKHGGFIRLRSSTRAGRTGTCFSVFIPILYESTAIARDRLAS